ncbi:MAG: ABC transporter permease, partial [Pseudomonadota bacterium]
NPRRIAFGWLVVVIVAFILIRALPGDPVALFLSRGNVAASDAVVADLRAAWGLDRSLFHQLVDWLGGFLTLDWGRSITTGEPILAEVLARLPWSIAIGLGGLLIAIGLGTFVGFEAALRPGGLADRLSRVLAVAAQAVPAFAIGFVLLWLFAVELRWVRPFSGGTLERLVLPVLLVALFSVGSVARVARVAFQDVLAAPWFRTALAKGLSARVALWRHGRRHAALTIAAAFSPELGWVIGGTVMAEVVFGIPGLSEYLVDAVRNRDYGAIQASVAAIGLWIVLALEAMRIVRISLEPRGGRPR